MSRALKFEGLPARLVLSATVAESEPNDAEVTGDPIHVPQDGQVVLTGVSTSDRDKDYFSISPTVGGPLTVSVESPNGNIPQLEITDRADNQLFETEPNDGINSGEVNLQAGIQYLIRLRSKNDDAAAYEVAIHFGGKTDNGDNGGSVKPVPVHTVAEEEANDSRSSANRVVFGPDQMVRLTGTAESKNDDDFFRFTPSESGELSVSVNTTAGALAKLSIEDAMGNKVAETEPNDGVNVVSGQVTAGVNYYVRMRSTDKGSSSYAVDLALNDGILLGDSDSNGRFDTADLVAIMQAGRYRTGEAATFAEGDWSGDGLFDEQDLLLAFQAGGFAD